MPSLAPEESHGAVLLADGSVAIAQAVLPVWARQLDVILEALNGGIAELSQALIALDALHTELDQAFQASAPAALRDGVARLSPPLHEQTTQALASLQMGDRLSQMLTVVRADMQRLIDHMPLEGPAGLAEAEQWLDDLRSRYTTPEQHAAHSNDAPPPPAAGVDYF